jgi:hypothetical protein
MRGADISQPSLFITRTVEDFVPANHPLRALRKLIDEALRDLDAHFNRLYADEGRESVAPERLIRASLLQVLYTIRSERQLVEVRYNLLYRWFVGLEMEDKVAPRRIQQEPERLLDEALMSGCFNRYSRLRGATGCYRKSISAWTDADRCWPRTRVSGGDEDFPRAGSATFMASGAVAPRLTTDPDAELMRRAKDGARLLVYTTWWRTVTICGRCQNRTSAAPGTRGGPGHAR